MSIRNSYLVGIVACLVVSAFAANGPPLAGAWNIAPTGTAGSKGVLVFRVSRKDDRNPIDIAVPVSHGSRQEIVARDIRDAFSSKLGRNYRVQLGEGDNVMVSDPRGRPEFSLELLDSDVDDLRVAVKNVTPVAAPTVPPQSAPVEPAIKLPPPNEEPGDAAPPPDKSIPLPPKDIPVPDPNKPADRDDDRTLGNVLDATHPRPFPITPWRTLSQPALE